jgi:hypothetical protein
MRLSNVIWKGRNTKNDVEAVAQRVEGVAVWGVYVGREGIEFCLNVSMCIANDFLAARMDGRGSYPSDLCAVKASWFRSDI